MVRSRRCRALLLVLLGSGVCGCATVADEVGGNARDAGTALPVRDDAGPNPDAGAGFLDVLDAGLVEDVDAGLTFGGGPGVDAGAAGPDAGSPSSDAGASDAGAVDGGGLVPTDAGTPTGTCIPLLAGSQLETGDTTGAPTWHRPSGTVCPSRGLDPTGTTVHYRTFVFCNLGIADALVDATLEGLGLSDPFLVAYAGEGIPSDPLQCVGADDDGAGFPNARLRDLTVAPGERLTIVATGYDNRDIGSFSLTISSR